MEKTIFFEDSKTITISQEEAWSLLAETNNLNQFIGLAPVQFTPFKTEEEVLVRHSETKVFGLLETTWTEHVFEWVRQHFYTIERIYSKGPVLRVLWRVEVEPDGVNKTVIRLTGKFTTRNMLGKLAIWSVIIPQLRKTFEYVEQFKKSENKPVIKAIMGNKVNVQEERLQLLAAKLRTRFSNIDMVERFLQTIKYSVDNDVTSMQAYKWADDNQFDKRLSVELFLLASSIGMLNQEWSMMCPNCRVPKGRTNTMKEIEKTIHCDLCGVDFEIDFDRYIELRFTVHESIREAQREIYCINGPMNSPHVLTQYRLSGQTTKEIDLPDFPMRSRWRVLRENFIVDVNDEERKPAGELVITSLGFQQLETPLTNHITVTNETNKEIVLVLEEVEWDEFALTAREVTSFQLFRDLFATEVLSTNQQISVGHLTILFTDLKGSTQLYESVGDGPAYSDVKKHFDYLMLHIKANEGAIVKTIGDSVMAVFVSESNALKAGIAIQEQMDQLNKYLTKPVQIRVGFHSGPVIAVNANEILDYFGRTVNLAARIESESLGGDIVVSESVYMDLSQQIFTQDILANYRTETFSRQLQGVTEKTKLVRILI